MYLTQNANLLEFNIMKKLIIIMFTAAALLMSCATTKPIKVETLDTSVFYVNHIELTSETIEPTDEELVQIFQLMPYSQVADAVKEKTGLFLDLTLIDEEYIKENIEYTVICDAESDEILNELNKWEVNFEVDESYEQLCDLYFSMNPPDGYLSVKAVMHTTQTIPAKKEGKDDKIVNLQSTVYKTFDQWTFKNIFVDPRSCAKIKFQKNLYPTFIQNELFSVYSIVNTSEDGYINLNVKEPVEIRCNIDDPGNMFFSPAQIYNARFEDTFQPGKKYILKYKLKRFSPDSTKWVVVFKLKEEKPDQTN